MTPEQIDALTLGEVRAICERAAETLIKARDVLTLLGVSLGPPPRVPIGARGIPVKMTPDGGAISLGEPFPCASCGRQSPELPGETCLATECQVCGNHLPTYAKPGAPSGRATNKGVLPPLTPEEKAKRMSLPAFDQNGDPI